MAVAWYDAAQDELTGLASAVRCGAVISLARVERLAADLVASREEHEALIVEALSNPLGDPLTTNLVNVAVVATTMGHRLGYCEDELERLALAALLHDVGLWVVPQSLVRKTGRLTSEERLILEQHPELGRAVISQAGPGYEWLATVVWQVHERVNGQGYPNRLSGCQIDEMAQLIGVADVFDALISARPYRGQWLPHEAMKELLVTERQTFPRRFVKLLVEQVSFYPLGTTVRLTTGDIGVVAGVNGAYPLRPVVLLNDQSGSCQRRVDLSAAPCLAVVEVVDAPAVERASWLSALSSSSVAQMHTYGSPDDQVASLLEQLDDLAIVMQGAMDSAPHPRR